MSYVKKRSALPVYFIGGTWLLWALLAPLYRPTHYIMAALASFIAYHVGKMLFPDRGYEVQDAPPSVQQAQAQPRPQPGPDAEAGGMAIWPCLPLFPMPCRPFSR